MVVQLLYSGCKVGWLTLHFFGLAHNPYYNRPSRRWDEVRLASRLTPLFFRPQLGSNCCCGWRLRLVLLANSLQRVFTVNRFGATYTEMACTVVCWIAWQCGHKLLPHSGDLLLAGTLQRLAGLFWLDCSAAGRNELCIAAAAAAAAQRILYRHFAALRNFTMISGAEPDRCYCGCCACFNPIYIDIPKQLQELPQACRIAVATATALIYC